MERYKSPAGHLATIFYKSKPMEAASGVNSDSSDHERGTLDEDVPPLSSSKLVPTYVVSSHNGRTLVWRNITLELKVGGEVKRLLDGLSG